MKKLLALLLAALMVISMFAACSPKETNSDKPAETAAPAAEGTEAPQEEAPAEDTITVLMPPVTGDYIELMDGWIADFQKDYPHIKVEVIATSWDDHFNKLSTMALAGEAPDIAEIPAKNVGTYVEMGVAVNIADYLPAERLADYDQNALDYLTLDNTLYGLPLYLTIQSLGGNKAMLEAAGVNVEDVQANGWTYDEFLAAIEKGTTQDTFGFVFANAGVCTSDMVDVFGSISGITSNFTDDLKYAYTSENMLNLLKAVETMVSSGFMPDYTVEAGQRLVMLQTGKTMITGKAMPLFENNVKKNVAAMDDGSAIEGSIDMEYVFLPVPTMEGVTEHCYGQVDGLIAMRNKNTTDEHLKNVCLFMDYLTSGERAATTVNQLLLACVCESGRQAQAGADLGQSPNNAAATTRCIGLVKAPPVGVTGEQAANALTVMNEVIEPKFQALLAGELTAEAMYEEVCSAAFELFGEDGCETGFIG